MAQEIDSTKLFELLDEIINKLGFGTLKGVEIQTEVLGTLTLRR